MELYKEIEKTFSMIEKVFLQEDLLNFKNIRVGDLYLYHFGLGTWIRNNLLYPRKSLLWQLFLKNGIEHPDDMSSLIISLFHYYISRKI